MHDVRNKVEPSKIKHLLSDVSEIHTYTTRGTGKSLMLVGCGFKDELKYR